MDISTMRDEKTHQSEINRSPLPGHIQAKIREHGMWVCSFYSGGAARPRRVKFRRFSYYVISHLIDGHGCYQTPEMREPVCFGPGAGVIVCPGQSQFYGGRGDVYVEDSIGFMGPSADALLKAGIIRPGVAEIGRVRKLQPIIEKIRRPETGSLIEANIALQSLLVQIRHENPVRRDAGPRYPWLRELVGDIQADPSRWWTVSGMAEYSNISENQLRRIFLKHTGMTPKEFVDRQKIQMAIEKLCDSSQTVREIAAALGYSDVLHFTRRFTRLTGLAPGRYRARFSPNSGTPEL
jgi:AraC-like DNA-binding protein